MSATFTINTAKLDQVIADVPERIDSWLESVAGRIVDEVKDSFGESPSVPGDPPGVVTGELKASVDSAKNDEGSGWLVLVGAEHGLYQEFGTETIAPRPFMRPIFHTWERKFAQDAVDFGLIK